MTKTLRFVGLRLGGQTVTDTGPDAPSETPLETVEPLPEPVEPLPEPVEPLPVPPAAPPEPEGPTTPVSTTQTAAVDAKRSNIITPELGGARITAIRAQPSRGWVCPNADGTISHILTDDTLDTSGSDSFSFELSSGQQVRMDLSIQQKPWYLCANPWPIHDTIYYELDDKNQFVLEPGPGHNTIHASGNPDEAWTRSEIEAEEKVSATSAWIANQLASGYGTEAQPLDPKLAVDVFNHLTAQGPQSLWLLLKCGYDYSSLFGTNVFSEVSGYSPLHPIVVGSYGKGNWPRIGSFGVDNSFHCGFQNVTGNKLAIGRSKKPYSNIFFDGIYIPNQNGQGNIEEVDGCTTRRARIYDSWRDKPSSGGNQFSIKGDRASGWHIWQVRGCILEDCMIDVAGYKPGYDYNASAAYGDPPEYFSHTIYSDEDAFDIDIENVITSRSAFAGFMLRSGGVVQDALAYDCNVGITHGSTSYTDINFAAFRDVVITSAGWRANASQGVGYRKAMGAQLAGYSHRTTLDQVICAHYNNPNEGTREPVRDGAVNLPAQYRTKDEANLRWAEKGGVSNGTGYEDIAHRRWAGVKDSGIEGLSTTALDQICVQNWVDLRLSKPLGSTDTKQAADYLRNLDEPWVQGREIVKWFVKGFGRFWADDAPRHMSFCASHKGTGVKWHEKWNWSGNRKPVDGDALDLYGHRKTRCMKCVRPSSLAMSGGEVFVLGFLAPRAISGPGRIETRGAGQLHLPGHSGTAVLDITVAGGRVLNTDAMTGAVDLVARGGETILATPTASWTQKAGSTLTVDGSGQDGIGFDGQGGGKAALAFKAGSTLLFKADGAGFGTIREFQSGRYGNAAPNVDSSVDLGGCNLTLDLSALPGGWSGNVIEADTVTGTFNGEIDVKGLGSRDLKVTIGTGAVAVSVTASGSGTITVK